MTALLRSIGIVYTPNIITIIGLLIAVAYLGSKIFQRLGIPQVVGYIVIGVFFGSSFLNIVPLQLSNELTFISEIALGLIGFDMGSHLYFPEVRKMGKSILLILFFECIGTFLLVGLGVFFVTKSLHTALLFGALASATAPAATVDVLAEYDAKGPLTTTLLAVVGLDDAFALLLFSVSAAMAESILTGSHAPTLLQMIELPVIEIGGSILLGAFAGFSLNGIMRWLKTQHDAMAVSIGFVFCVVGLSEALGLSLILSTMVMGVTIVNHEPEHGKHIRFTIEQAGPVIYVLFFALVGARFQVSLLPSMGVIGLIYIVLRSTGKYFGAWIGGTIGGAERVVRENLGLGLLSQAGVAIGLAIASCKRFSELGTEGEALGIMIISVITATTFVVQIFGPIGVKFAITRAGEVGRADEIEGGWQSDFGTSGEP